MQELMKLKARNKSKKALINATFSPAVTANLSQQRKLIF
jgi:hypothetical protein